MSHDFWMGLLVIPVLIGGLAVAAAAVLILIYVSAKVDLSAWKLWPKSADYLANRPVLAAVIVRAKSAHYLWIPGWHVVICRTALFNSQDAEDVEQHRRIQRAVRDALIQPKTNEDTV
ncbi:Uncharacterised protein [Mycobacteroides abscessus]|uniref:Uncharacterized protein n=3 Tax=Mycobacteroides abscessus TaxID=36809 RepID=A0AB74FAH5_9MYCO|nr:hypothetical protein [Mycobacteroides abscessus]AMU26612.1 hypothetical protein A3N96_15445 [Mycobacteroides abscessus]AMU36294.1 hypothetical protein A3N98_14635 [Mycobacteroides abscessus]AMU41341.1 hypothetical protein A3N99_15230 [Mycobacteroides abscessus]AMU61317.1 hypothetical protein A3O03_15350 [Mycobacteroides abscessus]MBN7344710.1 hypothetical protein [Mycobacteroides abscessus subsp. massiliense]